MAREQRIQEFRRAQVNPQETFDYTTPDLKVVAQPTDPFVQPNPNSISRQLAQALSALNPALQAYAQRQVDRYNEDFELGQLARATGKPKPTKSEAMIRGWEMLDGIFRGLEYKKEINQFYAQNYAVLSPEELAAGLDEIERRYLEGLTEWQQRGFIEKSIPAREQIEMAYTQAQSDLIRKQALDKLSQKAYDDIHTALLNGAVAAGFSSLEDVAGNPAFYAAVLEDETRKQLASYLRSIVTVTQNTIGKDLGFTKTDVASVYVHQIGQLAVELGLPELLDMAYIKDESGISIEGSTLGDTVRQYREKAEQAREKYIQAWERYQNELAAKRRNELMIRTHQAAAKLALMENPMEAGKEAVKWLNLMSSSPEYLELDEADYAKLQERFVKIAEGMFSFPETSNDYTYIELKRRALNGTLTWQDIDEAIDGMELNRRDAEHLMELMARLEEIKAQNEGKLPAWPHEKYIMNMQNTIIDLIGERNMFGVFNNGEEAANAELQFYDYLFEFLDANGRWPTFQEWKDQIASVVMGSFGLDFKDIYSATGPGTPGPMHQQQEVEEQEQPWFTRWWRGFLNFIGRDISQDVEASSVGGMSDEDSFVFLTQEFERGNDVQTIRQALLQAGETEEAVQRYFDMYRFRVADFFLNESGDRPGDAVRHGTMLLRAFGYTEDEIKEAFDWARYEGGLKRGL